jgi:hypothetical protein
VNGNRSERERKDHVARSWTSDSVKVGARKEEKGIQLLLEIVQREKRKKTERDALSLSNLTPIFCTLTGRIVEPICLEFKEAIQWL